MPARYARMRFLLAALCLAACSPAPAPSDAAQTPAPVERPAAADLRGEWRLAEMNGRKPSDAGGDATTPITMTVGDFTFRAQSQCIAIWRRYERQGDRLTVTPVNPGPVCARSLSAWETEFGDALSGELTASRSDGVLRLRGPNRDLTFEPAPAPARESFTGRWRLHRLDGAPSADGGPPLELTVTPDRIMASACVFSGWRYRQDGRLLEVTAMQEPVCERTLTPFEQRFAAFMSDLNRATIIQDGGLILDSASRQAEFRRVE